MFENIKSTKPIKIILKCDLRVLTILDWKLNIYNSNETISFYKVSGNYLNFLTLKYQLHILKDEFSSPLKEHLV